MFDPDALGLDVRGIHGDEAAVLCPFHDDHRATNAQFNVRKGLFYCFACGKRANARQIARALGGTLETLADTSFIRRAKDEKEWRHLLYAPLALDHPYLRYRGYTDEEVSQSGILEINESFLGIPVFRLGSEVPSGINLRRIPGSYQRRTEFRGRGAASLGWLSLTSARYILLGDRPPISLLAGDNPSEFLRDPRPVLVEGIFGAIRARRFGLRAYATLGAGISSRVLVLLNGRGPQVMFDDDFAGYVGAAKMLLLSTSARVLVPGIDFDILDTLEDYEAALKLRHFSNVTDDLCAQVDDAGAFYKALRLE